MTYLREKGECELAPARGAEGARDTAPGGLSGVPSAPWARGWEELEPGHGGMPRMGRPGAQWLQPRALTWTLWVGILALLCAGRVASGEILAFSGPLLPHLSQVHGVAVEPK